MDVFMHLSDREVKELMDKYMSDGMSEEDAFTEVCSIDCNMDEEEF